MTTLNYGLDMAAFAKSFERLSLEWDKEMEFLKTKPLCTPTPIPKLNKFVFVPITKKLGAFINSSEVNNNG